MFEIYTNTLKFNNWLKNKSYWTVFALQIFLIGKELSQGKYSV